MSQADPIRLLQPLSIFQPKQDASGDALSKPGCANACKDCACKSDGNNKQGQHGEAEERQA